MSVPDAPHSEERAPSFLSELARRRVPHIGLAYLGGVWTCFQFVQWTVRRYDLAAHIEEATLLGFLLLLPTVLVLAYRHGAAGRQRWRRVDAIVPAANVLLVIAAIGLLLGRVQHLEANAATVLVADAAAADTAMPDPDRRQVLAFFFEADGDDLGWLRTGLPLLMQLDVQQDPRVSFSVAHNLMEPLRREGFADGQGVPLALQRKLAQERLVGHVLSGRIARTPDGLRAEPILHEAATGRRIPVPAAEASSALALADTLTVRLKRALDLPGAPDVPDLPVAEVTSPDEAAVRALSQALDAGAIEQDYVAADVLLDEALALDPTFAVGHLQRFNVKWALQQEAEARRALAEAQRYSYRLTQQQQFVVNYVRFYIEKQPDEALEVLEQWYAFDPDDVAMLQYFSSLRLQRGETDEGIRLLRRLIDRSPEQRVRLIRLGDLLRGEERYPEAIAAYEDYIDTFPREAVGHLRVGYLHALTNEWEAALEAYRKGVAAEPTAQSAQLHLADSFTKLGRYSDARDALGEALTLARTPADSAGVWSAHITFYYRTGQYDEMLQAYDRLWAIEEGRLNRSDLQHERAEAAERYATAGEVEQAWAWIEEARAAATDATEFRKIDLNGHALEVALAAGDAERARQEFDVVVQQVETAKAEYQFEGSPGHLVEQGRLLMLEGDAAGAAEAFAAFIEEAPFSIGGWWRLGDAYRALGQEREALRHYTRALELAPAHADTHLGLARLHRDARRLADARTHAQQAVDAWAEADADHPEAAEARALLAELSAVATR